MKNNEYIGIFDSGFGGLSVLNQIKQIIPNENFIFLSDTLNNPYGKKSKETIINLSKNCVEKLINFNSKIIIIACNTATVTSFSFLCKMYPNIKLFGVFPTLSQVLYEAKYIKNTNISIKSVEEKLLNINMEKKKNNILILSTTATKNSDYLKNEIKTYKNFFNINVIAADEIVKYIETGFIDKENFENYIKELLTDYKNVDYLILGCTHFIFATDIIKKYISKNTKILNNIDIPIMNCIQYLENNNLLSDNKNGTVKIIDYGLTDSRLQIYNSLIDKNIKDFEFIK